MAGRSGSRVSPAKARGSTSPYQSPGPRKSALNRRRNRQRIADAQLREQPDQPAAFFVRSFVNPAEPLYLIRIGSAGQREPGRGLFGQEDRPLGPVAVLEPEAEESRIGAAHRLVTIDRVRRKRIAARRCAAAVDLFR